MTTFEANEIALRFKPLLLTATEATIPPRIAAFSSFE
jgi:hypothetical protein